MKIITQMPDDYQEPKNEPLSPGGCRFIVLLVVWFWAGIIYLIFS